jgi:transcriptional regulator with XRE-family HTH domain
MCDLDEYFKQKKAMGRRFKQFREMLGKSRKEIEDEANFLLIQEQRIKMVEIGAIIPDILFIQYFTENYGLNLTWLVKGTGEPFLKKNRGQMTEDRGQMTEDGRRKTENRDNFEKTTISRLINSIFYFIDFVYIIKLTNKYRLVALHKQRVLCDCYFLSFEECKIAFDKLFKEKTWEERVKADWSHFYPPDQNWLAKNQSYLESLNMA